MTAHEKALAYETEQRRYNFVRMWGKRYAHMKARAEGRSTNFSYSSGKDLLTRDEFFEWCKAKHNFLIFMVIYMDWVTSGFDLSLCPSVDRIDPDKGYVADNLQWLSFSDNCEKNHKYVGWDGKMVREKV